MIYIRGHLMRDRRIRDPQKPQKCGSTVNMLKLYGTGMFYKILHCRNGILQAPYRAKIRGKYLSESRADPRGVEGRASHQHGVEQGYLPW